MEEGMRYPGLKPTEPNVVLLYPPTQSLPDEGQDRPATLCKPNGSLAYPQLAASLVQHGVPVRIFDACVGNEKDNLDDIFTHPTKLETGLWRTGVPDERILEEVADATIVGLTSLFTDQETMVLRTASLIKKTFPEKLVIAGGVNARARRKNFLANNVDVVCLSEADFTIREIVDAVAHGNDFSHIHGIAWHGGENPSRSQDVIWDLDKLPIPAWHFLPLERYWKVARSHGGFERPAKEEHRYGSINTSVGCAFKCTYCHIAGETDGSIAGPIGRYRVKSDERVLDELQELKRLGATHIFLEDDMLFGYKERAIRLLQKMRTAGVEISDVNGLNVIHLFHRVMGGKNYEPDEMVINVLREANFRDIVLAFESATPHIIHKYATNKWDPERMDIAKLIRLLKHYNLKVGGNYMLGYPDETLEEINATVELAREHRAAGIDWCNFYAVLPLPGTPLFDLSLRNGWISPDFNPDRMSWTRSSIINSIVPAQKIEKIRQQAWLEINSSSFKEHRKGMVAVYNPQ
ncbi:MAG TPA: radical SAM protein [Candidatus Paceibacterota bacterium]